MAGDEAGRSLFPADEITDAFGAVTLAMCFVRFQMEHIACLIARFLIGNAQRQFTFEYQFLGFERMRVVVERRAGFALHQHGCLKTLACEHFDEIVAFHDRSPSPRSFLTHYYKASTRIVTFRRELLPADVLTSAARPSPDPAPRRNTCSTPFQMASCRGRRGQRASSMNGISGRRGNRKSALPSGLRACLRFA